MRKCFFVAACCLMFCAFVRAQETSDEPTFQRRLPAYYSDLVSDEQREQIYTIQQKYFQQINPLREQIQALEMKQQEEIEAVLSPEQRDKLKKAMEKARERRGLIRDLTPEQRRAADEAAQKAFLEAVRKAQEEGKPSKPDAGGAKTPSDG